MKVSVVVPAFNAEKWFAECLESVRNQSVPYSFKPVELLVVNDGSTDLTETIANKYTVHIARRELNHGIGATRHLGSGLAKGEYIAFLSADDAYHPYFLELMMREADGKSILFCDYWRCDELLNPTKVVMAPSFKTQRQFRKLVVEWALKQNMFVNFSTVIIPKYVFERVQFDEGLRYGEDLVFLLETVLAQIPWKHVELPLVYYRVHSEAGTKKGWNCENRSKLWSNLEMLFVRLGVSSNEILEARERAFNLVRRKQRKKKIPQPIIMAYRKLREALI